MSERLLIVEDDAISVLLIQSVLQKMGYAIAGVVATGPDALVKTRELKPDLILMDVRLRGSMSGIEAAAEIGRDFEIPVVYLTAYADETTLKQARTTSPYGYLVKPFREDELKAAIETALYKHHATGRFGDSTAF